jgi:pilus assembly protein CpaE
MRANVPTLLLIEDNTVAAELVLRTLSLCKTPQYNLERAGTLASGLSRLAAGDIDVVLLDLNLPDSEGFDTFARTQVQAGGTPIVVLTAHEDEELGLRTVRCGAQDYLIKGATGPMMLVRAVQYAIERHRTKLELSAAPAGPSRVISFIGAKGGVGTTTVALNVAAVLAAQPASVLAVELRPHFGNFSSNLRQMPFQNLSALCRIPPDQITLATFEQHLTMLPLGFRALFGPQRWEEFAELQPDHVEAILRAATRTAAYVIVDLPSQPSPAVREAIRHSAATIIVSDVDSNSIASGKALLSLLRSWNGWSGTLAGILLAGHSPVTRAAAEQLCAEMGCLLAGVLPQADEHFFSAQGVPMVIGEAEAPWAVHLNGIATMLTAGALDCPHPGAAEAPVACHV